MGSIISQGFVDSLKRKAKRLERERRELTHSQALDLIAQQEGYENWSLLARNVERCTSMKRVTKQFPYTIHLRGIASDSKRELIIRLSSKHPAAHYEKQHWIHWTLQGGSRRSDSEATAVMTDPGERSLWHRLVRAQRMVSFLDATDLRASRSTRAVYGSHSIPGCFDHDCLWKDAEGRYIVTVEPYMRWGHPDEIRCLCDSNEWQYELLPKGYGLWLPCDASCGPECESHTRMFVISPKRQGGDLQATVRAILSMPCLWPDIVADTAPCLSV